MMRETLAQRQNLTGFAALRRDAALPEHPVLADVLGRIARSGGGIGEITWKKTNAQDDSFAVRSDGARLEIEAGGVRAAVYAAWLLVQFAEDSGGLLPVGEIVCTPRCAFRSLKLYLPAEDKLDEFTAMIDLACRFRVNTILLEVGGGMEYRRHPEINRAWIEYCRDMSAYPERASEVQNAQAWDKNSIHFENAGGGVLSQETVRALVKYCRDRGLNVIPEEPTLSHADYILCAHPELAERPEDPYPDCYCPSNPKTYELVFGLLDEVLEVFEPEIVHIGHDEFYSMGLCPECAKKSGAEIFAGDVTRIHDYLAERGVRTMIWAEKLLNAVDAQGHRFGGSELTRADETGKVTFHRPETWRSADLLPRDILCMHWYWGIDRAFDGEFLRRGYPTVYGNFDALAMVNWKERLEAGILGGGPSHWSSLEWLTFQRNAVAANLLCAAMMFWTDKVREDNFRQVLGDIFEELYVLHNAEILRGPHLEIEHTTTVRRPYVYISSLPMQAEADCIGRYEITWESGAALAVDAIYGINVTHRDRCWTRTLHGAQTSADGCDSYWYDPLLTEVSGTALPIERPEGTYFRFCVKNPHPGERIVSVRVVKTAADEGELILAAVRERP